MYTSEFQPYSSNNSFQVTQKNLTQQITQLMEGTNYDTLEEENSFVMSSKLRQCQ